MRPAAQDAVARLRGPVEREGRKVPRRILQQQVVPGRIGIAQGVVVNVREPVQALRLSRLGDEGVGTDEAPGRRIVPAGPIVVQPDCILPALACKATIGRGSAFLGERDAEGAVAQRPLRRAACIGDDGRGAEVVGEEPVQPRPVTSLSRHSWDCRTGGSNQTTSATIHATTASVTTEATGDRPVYGGNGGVKLTRGHTPCAYRSTESPDVLAVLGHCAAVDATRRI